MRRCLWPRARSGVLSAAALAGVLTLVLTAVPASAGGPTSVLLVSAQHEQTASLYTTDQRYDRLLEALESDPDPDPGALRGANVGPGGRQITVTWLIHDTSIWRIDRVLLDAGGGPWIQTHISYDGVDLSEPGVWHRSPAPQRLIALMNRLGLTEGATPDSAGAAPHSAAAAAPEQPGTAAGAADTEGGARIGVWWWTLPALAIGLVAGVAGRPAYTVGARLVRHRASRREAGPRQQLFDL